jgi:hypothetical protein
LELRFLSPLFRRIPINSAAGESRTAAQDPGGLAMSALSEIRWRLAIAVGFTPTIGGKGEL